MRTTLTIDDDVAAALRRGLKELESPARARKPFRTRSVSAGRCLVGSLDDVTEAIAIAEGEDHH